MICVPNKKLIQKWKARLVFFSVLHHRKWTNDDITCIADMLKRFRFHFSTSLDADTKRNKIKYFSSFCCLNDRLCNEHKSFVVQNLFKSRNIFEFWLRKLKRFYRFLIFSSFFFSLQMKLFTLTLLALLQCICFHEVSCNDELHRHELDTAAANNQNPSDHNSSSVFSEKK